MYVRETDENGTKKEYKCRSYEEARKLLDSKADLDKATVWGRGESAEIKHGEERYTRCTHETNKWYVLSIHEESTVI